MIGWVDMVGPVAAGFVLDLWWGDPHWLPHPVRWMGWLIARLEGVLRPLLPQSPAGQLWGGGVLAAAVTACSAGCCVGVLWLCAQWSPWAYRVAAALVCYQMLAVRSLKQESMAVYHRLKAGDLPGARQAVSRIVGRDTQCLTAEGVAKAAVETVAENTSDGVVAPLFYLLLGGPVLGVVYKAVNTMDSMVGYKNERYLYFGRAAARLDDLFGFLPARIAGGLMVLSAGLLGMPMGRAGAIFLRDRRRHASPNSAHTEAACAGALGVQLAGDASYFGRLHHKPTIGDPLRPVVAEDIVQANQLLYATAALALLILGGLSVLLCIWAGRPAF